MGAAKEAIFTCAGCGRTFKASIDTKVFKCASCQDLIGAVDDSMRPNSGKVVCANCWSAVQLRDELSRTSQALFGDAPPAAEAPREHYRDENTARVAELEAKLAVASDSREAAQKERDLAIEVRQKFERTLADFLGKFAMAREAELKLLKERDAATESVRTTQRSIKDLEAQLVLAQETEAAALAERNEFAEISTELEARLTDLESKMATTRIPVADSGPRGSSTRIKAVTDGKMEELQGKLTAKADEWTQLRKEADEERRVFQTRIGDLHGELVAAQVDRVAMTAERDVASAARVEAEAKLEDCNMRLARAQEAHTELVKKCDEALNLSRQAQEEGTRAKTELARLREVALASLEPLAGEIDRELQILADEAANASRPAPEIAARIAAVRAQLLGRVYSVLGGRPAPAPTA